MFGLLWNVVVTHEHQQQDGSRIMSIGYVQWRNTRQRPMNERRNLEIGIPITSVADGASALCAMSGLDMYDLF